MPDSAEPEEVQGTVPFGNETGVNLREEWHDGIVVLGGNDAAPDYVTVFYNGEARFLCSDGEFTPRVEDWSDSYVKVLLDTEVPQ